jgi:hypothetical protein
MHKQVAAVTARQLGVDLGRTKQRIAAFADFERVIERLPGGRFDHWLSWFVCQTFDPNSRLYQRWTGSARGLYDHEKDYRPCSYRALSCRVRDGR